MSTTKQKMFESIMIDDIEEDIFKRWQKRQQTYRNIMNGMVMKFINKEFRPWKNYNLPRGERYRLFLDNYSEYYVKKKMMKVIIYNFIFARNLEGEELKQAVERVFSVMVPSVELLYKSLINRGSFTPIQEGENESDNGSKTNTSSDDNQETKVVRFNNDDDDKYDDKDDDKDDDKYDDKYDDDNDINVYYPTYDYRNHTPTFTYN